MELRATASEIAAPKPDLDAGAKKVDFEAILKINYKMESHQRQEGEKKLANRHGNLDAATPMRSTTVSCKRR